MRFLSIYRPNKKTPPNDPDHRAAMGKLMEAMIKRGVLEATGAITGSQATVRYEGREHTVTDGPYTESKEMLAGWAILRADSKEEITEITQAFLKVAGEGSCELREILEMEDFPVDPAEKEGGWRDQEEAHRVAAAAERPGPFLPPAPPGKQRYMVFIKADAFTEGEGTPSEALLSDMGALMTEYAEAGKILGGEGLKPSKRGLKVNLASGRFGIVDGPFAETKELMAGYTSLEVESLADAIAFAKRMIACHVNHTGAPRGEIEIFGLM